MTYSPKSKLFDECWSISYWYFLFWFGFCLRAGHTSLVSSGGVGAGSAWPSGPRRGPTFQAVLKSQTLFKRGLHEKWEQSIHNHSEALNGCSIGMRVWKTNEGPWSLSFPNNSGIIMFLFGHVTEPSVHITFLLFQTFKNKLLVNVKGEGKLYALQERKKLKCPLFLHTMQIKWFTFTKGNKLNLNKT